ncbi:MAG: hypothetical protein NSGCLCUN01_02812 [uncultured Clostridium sp.]
MREVVAIREDITRDTNISPEEYRVYSYLRLLEKDEPIDVDQIAKELILDINQVMKCIIRLAELGYTADLECLS